MLLHIWDISQRSPKLNSEIKNEIGDGNINSTKEVCDAIFNKMADGGMVIDIGSVSREIGELLWKSKNA